MMNLTNIQDIKALMAVYDIAPRKKYGQNFLIDEGVLEEIVAAAGVDDGATVLEIGPGIGALTRVLALHASKVVAVEIDEGLIPVLKGTVGDCPNVTVINDDIMKTDLNALYEEYGAVSVKDTGNGEPALAEDSGKDHPSHSGVGAQQGCGDPAPAADSDNHGRFHVVANLPYYITTPVVMKLLEHADIISDITIMIQKEVAERMQASPGGKEYGALSLYVQYYADPQIVCHVPARCFYPAPEVDSVVIRLASRLKPPVKVRDTDLMFKLIRGSFNMRRKTLVNAICGAGLGFSREQIEQALAAMNKSATVRGETFTLEDFAALTDHLSHTIYSTQ